MKRKGVIFLLLAETIVCVLLSICYFGNRIDNISILTIPLIKFAEGLRSLSLAGKTGNVIAMILYIGISSIPIGVFVFRCKGKKQKLEDGLLPILTVLVLVVLYLLINPGYLDNLGTLSGAFAIKELSLCLTVYTFLLAYIFFRIIRASMCGGAGRLYRYLRGGLLLVAMYFVFSWAGTGLTSLVQQLNGLNVNNTEENLITFTKVFQGILYAVKGIPVVLDVVVVLHLFTLVQELEADSYSEAVILKARKLKEACRNVLFISLFSSMFVNVAQLVASRYLLISDITLMIPLGMLAFTFFVMVLCRYFMESRELKQDVESFI